MYRIARRHSLGERRRAIEAFAGSNRIATDVSVFLNALATVRIELQNRRLEHSLHTPPLDTEASVPQLEKAFEAKWRRWPAGLAPESFNVVAQSPPASHRQRH